MIGRFMFGPNLRDEEIVSLQVNPHVGGSFSFVVRRNDLEIDHIGEYLEINRPKLLVFSWAVRQDLPDTSYIVIEIEPVAGGCELTLTQKMPSGWADFKDNAEAAWTKMLNALETIMAA